MLHPATRRVSCPSRDTTFYVTALLIIVFLSSTNIVLWHRSHQLKNSMHTQLLEGKLHSYQGELPLQQRPVVMEFKADYLYDIRSDGEWGSLLPQGYLDAKLTADTLIPSVYNELDCLDNLRKIYMSPGWENNPEIDKLAHHCINVVRQAIICNGDITVESSVIQTLKDGRITPAATGMGVEHVCRDWTKVRQLTEEQIRTRI
ncbi:hypothetical protein CPB83DRAFT_855697 [Crepidotus variabilis]|uniref:Uncharacterized protein n=1 Tax=Crepidotus variabilis TaxID=179855 RepID=A0A9P6EF03_9AGAR|nr:hypothetical protein CPB83DRAFT_855697 [Crepidotus variabilis]